MNKIKGFSLLEILVAFSILSVSLGILLKIFSSGVNTAMVAEEYTAATQIAESLMAETSVIESLDIGETSGNEVEKYYWQVNIEKMENPVIEDNVGFMSVKVVVEWDSRDKNKRYIELNSIKPGLQNDN